MSYEGLGLSPQEQLEIRERAVMGAIEDVIAPVAPLREALASDEVDAQINDAIAKIVEIRGVSPDEARLILAEQLLMIRNTGELNGEDF